MALALAGPNDPPSAPMDDRRIIPRVLTRPQKAAVIVRLLLAEGANLPLDQLDDATQAALTEQMAGLRLIDRATLQAVIEEFSDELAAVGLSFPGGLAGALDVLDGHINPATALRLRREAGVAARGDPWERLSELPTDQLQEILRAESTEVGAVLLAKLEVGKAAEILGGMDNARARQLSFAMSRTGRIAPTTVTRIGLSLAAQVDAVPAPAFDAEPVARVGAILNSSQSTVRDAVLDGLDEDDAAFAAEVRREIFTFAMIPKRLAPKDVPLVLKAVDTQLLITALAHSTTAGDLTHVAPFLFENIGKRMAEQLQNDVNDTAPPLSDQGEEALQAVVAKIRGMADAGEITLLTSE